jgi:hypothetical protein
MAVVFAPLAVSLLVRLVLTRPLHGRAPRTEAAVDRWWTWAPLVTVIIGAWLTLGVAFGVGVAVGALVLIQVTDERVDAPFRIPAVARLLHRRRAAG